VARLILYDLAGLFREYPFFPYQHCLPIEKGRSIVPPTKVTLASAQFVLPLRPATRFRKWPTNEHSRGCVTYFGPVITQLTFSHFVHDEGYCCVIALLNTSILSTHPLRTSPIRVSNLALTNHAFFNTSDLCIQTTKNPSCKTTNQRLRRTSDALYYRTRAGEHRLFFLIYQAIRINICKLSTLPFNTLKKDSFTHSSLSNVESWKSINATR